MSPTKSGHTPVFEGVRKQWTAATGVRKMERGWAALSYRCYRDVPSGADVVTLVQKEMV